MKYKINEITNNDGIRELLTLINCCDERSVFFEKLEKLKRSSPQLAEDTALIEDISISLDEYQSKLIHRQELIERIFYAVKNEKQGAG